VLHIPNPATVEVLGDAKVDMARLVDNRGLPEVVIVTDYQGLLLLNHGRA
jgi:hypothetical protein